MRILAIDPGEKNIGIAISDPTGTIANPLTIIKHVSRLIDAATIAQLATENDAKLILVGQALNDEGKSTPQSRRSVRLAAAIKSQTDLPVELWDESGSTQAARQARIMMGTSRKKRAGHLDDLAATYILQTYLDVHPP
ncbi:MAG: Holliday junction resolvase RuvX [Anaerolineales bacterium]|nr:Holliday junction resolvase RuvX [Anaerolineales bacterium]